MYKYPILNMNAAGKTYARMATLKPLAEHSPFRIPFPLKSDHTIAQLVITIASVTLTNKWEM